MNLSRWLCLGFLLAAGACLAIGLAPAKTSLADPAETEAADKPLPLDKSAGAMTVPEGFQVTLFAGEPDVVQPIGMTIDERGRLWICEALNYPTWAPEGNDRVCIFEDTDHDGRFDKKKVFWDQGNYLTSALPGFGGVFVCTTPHLLFIPDANGDDVPDGEPEVLLDGWSTKGRHNIVNGLTWGPDGWLYGLNGITAPSKVGKPGTPDDQRQDINCGVWRYHPTRKVFEVVAHGTTNPWGLDFDDYGQGFLTNCVIEHLWHLVPGAHFKRMFGQDYDPHVYQLMQPASDHIHWAGGDWRSSRGGHGEHSKAGGGHAHAGAMIYLGDRWPDEYRNGIFTCNIHGARVNHDRLTRRPGGYVGKHADDFLYANDTWFRGLELVYGPDGDAYVTDWNDTGECHDYENTQVGTGRIYKVTYGEPRKPEHDRLSDLSNAELIALQTHTNEFYVRNARRILQERVHAGAEQGDVHAGLRKLFAKAGDVRHKLRALWALYGTGGADEEFLLEQLQAEDENVRAWAIKLLVDGEEVSPAAAQQFVALAKADPSPFVRLHLASALQRLPLEVRWPIAEGLVTHAEDAEDVNLSLMVWYGVEPLAAGNKPQAVQLAAKCKLPLVRQYIARRVASNDAE